MRKSGQEWACFCGCGNVPAGDKAGFKMGHDMTAKSRLKARIGVWHTYEGFEAAVDEAAKEVCTECLIQWMKDRPDDWYQWLWEYRDK